jgi:cell division septation protein DedD
MTPDVTWHAFDPHEPGSPPSSLDGTGAVAVVPAGDPQWAAAASVGLARALARSGRRVFLCDAAVEEPRLHGFFSGDPGEGVSDLVLYGASPRRVASEVEKRLLFVAAGTAVADGGQVRASPRWDALVDAVVQADGILLLHLPAEGAGTDALLARAERVVVAGDPAQVPELGEAADRFVAGLHPVGAHLPAVPSVPAATEPGSEAGHGLPELAGAADEGAETSEPDVHIASGAEVETPATPGGEVLDDPRVREAVARARRGSPPARDEPGSSRTLLLLLLLVVVAVLVAAFLGLVRIPGLTPAQAGAVQEAALPEPPVRPTSDAYITAPHHRWNLALGSYTDAGVAEALAARLDAAHPDVTVVVASVRVEGTTYHRVLAGPLPDSLSAAALAPRLAPERTEGEGWMVRAAPLAFQLGEFDVAAAAEHRRGTLAETGLPAHVLALDRSDGATVYRIYVGAYADAEEASWMAARLAERTAPGDAPLVDRRGTPPA